MKTIKKNLIQRKQKSTKKYKSNTNTKTNANTKTKQNTKQTPLKYIAELKNTYSTIKFNKSTQHILINKVLNVKKRFDVKYKTNLLIINFKYVYDTNIMSFDMIDKDDIQNGSRTPIINDYLIILCKWICIHKKQDLQSYKPSPNNNNNNNSSFETCILLYMSDRIIWHITDIDKQLPICLFAQPNNNNYILIPDMTFHNNSEYARYGINGINWADQKALFTKTTTGTHDKKDIIFFKGMNTTLYNHNLREYIKNNLDSETDILFKNAMYYKWLTKYNYESVETFSKYKFLLNLPGRYPWSTRLKYLYLSKSFIINVRVKTLGDGNEDFYKSFVDLIVPDTLCFNIDMTYYYYDEKTHNKDNKANREAQASRYTKLNNAECLKVYKQIKQIYYKYRKHNPNNNKNVIKAYNLINNFTINDINEYYYNIITMNYKLGLQPHTPEYI